MIPFNQDVTTQSNQSNCQNLDEISSNDLEINKSLIYASCVMCSDKDDNDVIECSICHNWIHFQCTKLPAYQIQIFINTNRKLTCENCANQPEEELVAKCFDNCFFEILQLKDNRINEKSKESERLQNEIIMIRRRCEEIENTNMKKINNYKTQISELSAKAESHINLKEKYSELSSKNEKQQTVLATKTKEINNL